MFSLSQVSTSLSPKGIVNRGHSNVVCQSNLHLALCLNLTLSSLVSIYKMVESVAAAELKISKLLMDSTLWVIFTNSSGALKPCVDLVTRLFSPLWLNLACIVLSFTCRDVFWHETAKLVSQACGARQPAMILQKYILQKDYPSLLKAAHIRLKTKITDTDGDECMR